MTLLVALATLDVEMESAPTDDNLGGACRRFGAEWDRRTDPASVSLNPQIYRTYTEMQSG
jgi:hypothetical protein